MKHILLPVTLAAAMFFPIGKTNAAAPAPGHKTGVVTTVVADKLGSARFKPADKGTFSDAPQRLGERNPLVPPFVEYFDDFPKGSEHAEFERRFQVIDNNTDNRTWAMYNPVDYSKCAYMLYPLEDGVLSDVPGRTEADDWLIPRAIKLEGGKYYHVSVDASLYKGGSQQLFEVKMGYYNDVEGMQFNVIEPTIVDSRTRKQAAAWFKAPDSGIYYLGIHGISTRSGANSDYLFIDNIQIEAASTGLEPEHVTDVAFVNDPAGTPELDITLKMPTTTVDGSALTGTVDLIVKRGDVADRTLVTTITGKQPGETINFKDNPGVDGIADYTFITRNSAGDGGEYTVRHFAGFVAPEVPVITSMEEIDVNRIQMKWDAPKRDLNGNALNADAFLYNIYDYSTDVVLDLEKDYAETVYTMDVAPMYNGQNATFMIVTATLNGNESGPAPSGILVTGTPYSMPYTNSFANASTERDVIVYDSDEGVYWGLIGDNGDPKPQDDDNGYICMIGTQYGEQGEFQTGKIDATATKRPYVSLYTYAFAGDKNNLSISVIDCSNDAREEVGKFCMKDFEHQGWNRIIVPIDKYAGKIIRLVVRGELITGGHVAIDNLSVDEFRDIDLGIETVITSRYARADKPYKVSANVVNYGLNPVNSYDVNLYCNGTLSDTKHITTELAHMGAATVELSKQFAAVSPDFNEIYVEVVAQGDEYPANNSSKPVEVNFVTPIHPVVTGLKGEENASTVKLTWNAPDLTQAPPAEQLEDFEKYTALTTRLQDGWTMYDGDKGYVAGYTSFDFPLAGTQQAWWTITNEPPYDFFETLGNSSLVQMASGDDEGYAVECDDWLISPELFGGVQSIGFMARSYTVAYGYETFELKYSTTDNNPASFQPLLDDPVEVGEDWTQFYVKLPQDTKYFAIRCISFNCFNMMLDNISYTPAGTPMEYKLNGYNIYRNGEKINDVLVKDCSFDGKRDLDVDEYFVTAVYDRGESAPSNIVRLASSGVEDVNTAVGARIEVRDRTLYITGSIGENNVYGIDGTNIYRGNADVIELPSAGVYVVRSGAMTQKVIVK